MDDRDRAMNDILDLLAYMRAQLDELLRRVPEPRCMECGMEWSAHARGKADHEFMGA